MHIILEKSLPSTKGAFAHRGFHVPSHVSLLGCGSQDQRVCFAGTDNRMRQAKTFWDRELTQSSGSEKWSEKLERHCPLNRLRVPQLWKVPSPKRFLQMGQIPWYCARHLQGQIHRPRRHQSAFALHLQVCLRASRIHTKATISKVLALGVLRTSRTYEAILV